jgi:hypothetical protein
MYPHTPRCYHLFAKKNFYNSFSNAGKLRYEVLIRQHRFTIKNLLLFIITYTDDSCDGMFWLKQIGWKHLLPHKTSPRSNFSQKMTKNGDCLVTKQPWISRPNSNTENEMSRSNVKLMQHQHSKSFWHKPKKSQTWRKIKYQGRCWISVLTQTWKQQQIFKLMHRHTNTKHRSTSLHAQCIKVKPVTISSTFTNTIIS